ncbi:hypothetical protein AAY81_03700 [Denitrobacterium detoxificans]|uniref:Exodeoxyribonuclease VII small subunit n=1 Tax=Denitrobacterium detoxificans TaxID=79604 RepID=A0A172RXN2_9ACTN|nr:exodeoxyribonuclease VII small subunit [Denitrobacterium detoxificans]ANE22383.1 hypothetical protein AAY81_03700 [Denitrobacterium detoxificans]SEO93684.1 Exodeoxyribonuclease VII small subunit [Denitrobacterium detoxificans]
MSESENPSFESINTRLKEIQAAVEDDDMPLDDALSLFEEAVQLGMQASSLLEEGIAQGGAPEGDEVGAPGIEESVASDGERSL